MTTKIRFLVLNHKGHEPREFDAGELEKIEAEFQSLIQRGYAAFFNETQLHKFSELQRTALNPSMAIAGAAEIFFVPQMAGGCRR